MSVDRDALVKSVLDTLGLVALGPTVRAFPTTDYRVAQIPFDSVRARFTLDSLGWTGRNERGIRTRNGRLLAFDLLVPTSSNNRMRMAVLLQAELQRAGVRVDIQQMDNSALMAKEEARNFDAVLGSWHLGTSPEGARQAWSSAAATKDGVNYGSYKSATFDAQLDTAMRADSAHARERFTLAYATINQDAPAVWLYEPRTVIGLHRRFTTSWMRPDAWWVDLGNWHKPPQERIPRERLPVAR
jgi:peptide/nickel transport system substrate-binding protein